MTMNNHIYKSVGKCDSMITKPLVRKHKFILLRYINTQSNLDREITLVEGMLTKAREKLEEIKKDEDETGMKFGTGV